MKYAVNQMIAKELYRRAQRNTQRSQKSYSRSLRILCEISERVET
jgi:hypothetical protein